MSKSFAASQTLMDFEQMMSITDLMFVLYVACCLSWPVLIKTHNKIKTVFLKVEKTDHLTQAKVWVLNLLLPYNKYTIDFLWCQL